MSLEKLETEGTRCERRVCVRLPPRGGGGIADSVEVPGTATTGGKAGELLVEG